MLIIIGTVINPNFFSINNFTEIGQFSSALGVVVVAESLVLLTGGLDLSLESTYGLAPMVAAWTILSRNLFGAGLMLSPYLALLVAARRRGRSRDDQRLAHRKGPAERVHRHARP